MPFQYDEHQHLGSAFDISRGYYGNVTPVNIFGFNRTIATSFETIANDGGGLYTFPSTGLTMSLVSSQADTCTITIVGLDAEWNPITEAVVLTGTTPVTTTHQFFRINYCFVSAGTQSGNITISNGGTTYGYIEAETGTSQTGIYSTGKDECLYIASVSFLSGTVNSNKYLTGRVYKRTYGNGIQRFWQATWSIGQVNYSVPIPFKIPPKTDFAFEAKSSSGDNEIAIFANCFSVVGE
jgi:hypothetical protein